jgi:hypothetical protein
MGVRARLTITVTSGRNTTNINYRGQGFYRQLQVGNVDNDMPATHVLTSEGSKAFWDAALALVVADIAAGNGGGT